MKEQNNNLQDEIICEIVKITDNKLWEFFTPHLRKAGIKGEITKGKIKWRGIKMIVENDLIKTTYQLTQRGVIISPIFSIDFSTKFKL